MILPEGGLYPIPCTITTSASVSLKSAFTLKENNDSYWNYLRLFFQASLLNSCEIFTPFQSYLYDNFINKELLHRFGIFIILVSDVFAPHSNCSIILYNKATLINHN